MASVDRVDSSMLSEVLLFGVKDAGGNGSQVSLTLSAGGFVDFAKMVGSDGFSLLALRVD